MALHYLLQLLQITKPIKRPLNSSNLNFLYNLVFSLELLWGNRKGKKV